MTGKHEKRHQVFPDPRVVVLEWDVDGYPVSVLVTMGDKERTVMEFQRKINQPHPYIDAAIRNIENLERMGRR